MKSLQMFSFGIALFMTSLSSCKKNDDIQDPKTEDPSIEAGPDSIFHNWAEILKPDSFMLSLEGALTVDFTVNAFNANQGLYLGQTSQYDRDIILIKINLNNEIAWVKNFSLTNSFPIDLETDEDGSAFLFYYDGVASKPKIAKISPEGNIDWAIQVNLLSDISYYSELAWNDNNELTITNKTDYLTINSESGTLVSARILSIDLFNLLQHNGKYFGASRVNGGGSVALYQLNEDFEIENTKMISVAAHNHNMNSMFFIGNTLYVGVTVDQYLAGMETRIFTFDENLNALSGFAGHFIGQYGTYMFSQMHLNTYVLNDEYFVFGGFHSQGNLGNLDLGYHTVLAKTNLSQAYSFDVGVGGILLSSSEIHASGVSGFIEQISHITASSSCMSDVTFEFENIGTPEILTSTYTLTINTESTAGVENSSATLNNLIYRQSQSEYCIEE